MLCSYVLHATIALFIGFDPDSYRVNEDDGTVELTVRVIRGMISEGRTIPVRITTSDSSALGKHFMTMKDCDNY